LATPESPEKPREHLTTSAAVALVTGASYVALAIGLLRGLIYTGILSPTSRGIVQVVFLFGQYLTYSHLGITHGLTKRVPILLGEGDERQAGHLERAGTTAVFVLTLAAAAIMWGYGGIAPGLEGATRVAIAVGGFHLIFGQLAGIYRIILRSHHEFGVIARSTLVEAVLLFTLVVAGAQLADAPGTVTGWALGMAAVTLYLLAVARVPGSPVWDVRAAAQLARVGLPVLLVGLADVFLRTADNLVVAKLMGMQALGYYGTAWQLASYLFNVPASAGFVIMPKILRAHGEGSAEAMRRSVLDMTTAFAILMPPLAGLAAIAGPILVRLVLPKYIPCIGPLQVFMVSVTFLAIPLALRTVLIARNREIDLILCQGIGGLLIAGAVFLLIRAGADLTQIALAGAGGLLLASIAMSVRGLQVLAMPAGPMVRYLGALALPFAYCLGLLLVAKLALPRWLPSASPVVWDLVALPVFAAASAPLVWIAERQTGIIRKMRARGGAAVPASEEPADSLPPDRGPTVP
jgi:O-antigen/teichoic acid export membrane protein